MPSVKAVLGLSGGDATALDSYSAGTGSSARPALQEHRMTPSLQPAQPPRYEPEPRDRHLARGLRAALALALVLAVLGTLFLVVATQVLDDSPSSLSTRRDPAGSTLFPGA
jgi:hypothetical protein